MFGWMEVVVRRERNEDLRREAERFRLVRQALAGRERHDRFYCRALTWLGRRLVAWGKRLQERYSVAAATPVLGAPDRA